MANKIKHLIDYYQQLRQHDADCVMATIIETFGSTYQKAGARMLITHSGELIGLLGGGCFEQDLVEHAGTVFATGSAKTVFYDMRAPADVVWGLGLGCNGAVRVLLQLLLRGQNFSPLNHLVEAAETQTCGVLVTVTASEHTDFPVGQSIFLTAATTDDHRQLQATAPLPFTDVAQQVMRQQQARTETHVIDNQSLQAFYDPIQPPLRLLIFGAGVDAIPLVSCAKALGWQVTVVDHRPGYLNAERFPKADLLYSPPEELYRQLPSARFDAMVLMTHNLHVDQRYLQAVLNFDLLFIGLLGPAQRKDKLLQSLGAAAELIRERVFGPVGLDIGAETPQEIALSIMAGIYARLNNRSGQPLQPFHTSTTADAKPC